MGSDTFSLIEKMDVPIPLRQLLIVSICSDSTAPVIHRTCK